MKKMKKIKTRITQSIVLALLVSLTAGCSLAADAIRSGLTPGPEACDFTAGQATQEQVEAVWGSPDGWKRDSDGQRSLTYRKGFATASATYTQEHVLRQISCERGYSTLQQFRREHFNVRQGS